MASKKTKTSGKCLLCDHRGELQRGLCPAHYSQYARQKKKAKESGIDVEAWEQELVSKNYLAPDGRSHKLTSNVFAEELAVFELSRKIEANATARVEDKDRKAAGPEKGGQPDG